MKFCKEELEVFYEFATLTRVRANLSQCTSRDFLGAGNGWLPSVSFLDVSQTLAGIAVLCTCNVRCGVKHHRTYIQTKRRKYFCEKQCETSLLRQTSSFAQDLCSASWMKQSARETSTLGFATISPTVHVFVSPATKEDPLAPHRNSALAFFHGIVAGGNVSMQCGRFRVACTLVGSGR